jgi:prepilin-type N-terminal cleavage/methylation domain-containing protein
MQNPQRGFTLIEIAIVLVIIGLLLGGVLKGQEMIENGKIRNAANELNGISAAFNSYRDRYRQLPGDDSGGSAGIAARGTAWTDIPAGNGNGVLDISDAQTFTGAGEGDNFWRQLRAAGLLTGNPADAAANSVPKNAYGGPTGITNAPMGISGPAICMGGLPGKAALALDTQLDDGTPNAGSTRATTASANNTAPAAAVADAATAYREDALYTVCRAA